MRTSVGDTSSSGINEKTSGDDVRGVSGTNVNISGLTCRPPLLLMLNISGHGACCGSCAAGGELKDVILCIM